MSERKRVREKESQRKRERKREKEKEEEKYYENERNRGEGEQVVTIKLSFASEACGDVLIMIIHMCGMLSIPGTHAIAVLMKFLARDLP